MSKHKKTSIRMLKLMKDAVKVQMDYIQDFEENYYGKDGLRSEEMINNSLDGK